MTSRGETIFAIASGAGRTALAVVRLSGPDAAQGLIDLVRGPLPPPRRLVLRRLLDPEGRLLDTAMIVWMPAPGSFTGEDQAELHIHGGPAVRGAILDALAARPGCRAAQPGEFTRRAFLNGRLDLTAVEGLADLLEAETEVQRRQALRHLEGEFGRRIEAWRSALLDASAQLEAQLDFADEGDVPRDGLTGPVQARCREVRAGMRDLIAQGDRGERLRDGFVVVLAGPPNAGKSTLLNALAGRDAAIVSPVPGTTRDAIEVRLSLEGLPVTLIDTAGLRESPDGVEAEGVRRTRRHLGTADLAVWLVPPGGAPDPAGEGTAERLVVASQADRPGRAPVGLPVSAATGLGMDALRRVIAERARQACGDGGALLTRARHRAALARADAALGRVDALDIAAHPELAAEELRLALDALGEIVGRVRVDDVLDRLFAGFCIGK